MQHGDDERARQPNDECVPGDGISRNCVRRSHRNAWHKNSDQPRERYAFECAHGDLRESQELSHQETGERPESLQRVKEFAPCGRRVRSKFAVAQGDDDHHRAANQKRQRAPAWTGLPQPLAQYDDPA
jgi:hypothetical protein